MVSAVSLFSHEELRTLGAYARKTQGVRPVFSSLISYSGERERETEMREGGRGIPKTYTVAPGEVTVPERPKLFIVFCLQVCVCVCVYTSCIMLYIYILVFSYRYT